MADVLRLAAPAWKACRRLGVSAIHSSFLQHTSNRKRRLFFLLLSYLLMRAGSRSREVQDASPRLFASTRGDVKVGSPFSFICAGPCVFWGRTKYLLVFQDFGRASVGEVQYQGISSLWQWPQSSLRGLFPSKERPPCVNVITV